MGCRVRLHMKSVPIKDQLHDLTHAVVSRQGHDEVEERIDRVELSLMSVEALEDSCVDLAKGVTEALMVHEQDQDLLVPWMFVLDGEMLACCTRAQAELLGESMCGVYGRLPDEACCMVALEILRDAFSDLAFRDKLVRLESNAPGWRRALLPYGLYLLWRKTHMHRIEDWCVGELRRLCLDKDAQMRAEARHHLERMQAGKL